MSLERLIEAIYDDDGQKISTLLRRNPDLELDSATAYLILTNILGEYFEKANKALLQHYSLTDIVNFITDFHDQHRALIAAITRQRADIVKQILDMGFEPCSEEFDEALTYRNREIIEMLMERGCKYPEPKFSSQSVQCDIIKLSCNRPEQMKLISEFSKLEREQRDYFTNIFPLRENCDQNLFFIIAYKDLPEGTLLCGSMLVGQTEEGYYVYLFATQTLKNRAVKGIGADMIKFLIEDARRNRIEKIRLMPVDSSKSFYQSLGFGPEDEDELYYEYIL